MKKNQNSKDRKNTIYLRKNISKNQNSKQETKIKKTNQNGSRLRGDRRQSYVAPSEGEADADDPIPRANKFAIQPRSDQLPPALQMVLRTLQVRNFD